MSGFKIGDTVRTRHAIIQDANDYSPDLLMASAGDVLEVIAIKSGSTYPIEIAPVGRPERSLLVAPGEIELAPSPEPAS